MQFKNALTAVAIAVGALAAAPAHAVVSEGVDYTASWADLAGDLWQLTITVDAAGNTFGASFLQAVSVVPGGAWSNVSLFSSTNAGTLGAGGIEAGPTAGGQDCQGSNASAFCVDGSASVASPITLVFQFNDPSPSASPHLQVSWDVVGHHFSQEVPAVPEPETYAMMLAGLVAVGSLARRRRGA